MNWQYFLLLITIFVLAFDEFDLDDSANELEKLQKDNPHSRLKDVLELKDLKSIKDFYQNSSSEQILEDFFKLKLQYEETKSCLKLVTDALDYSSNDESESDSSECESSKTTENKQKSKRKRT